MSKLPNSLQQQTISIRGARMHLRLLFARAGTPHCPDHYLPLQSQTVSQIADPLGI